MRCWAAVESVRERLTANADEGEAIGSLPQDSVAALYDSGLMAYKVPEVLGGAEADLLMQLDVVEAVTRIDPAAGWCLMIGAASIANMGAFLPDDGIAEVFASGRIPLACGVFAPRGAARPVEGGYVVDGRWPFGSGVRHSEWVSAGAWVMEGEGKPSKQIRVVFPVGDACIHDNWQVMGLKGTGSCDYSVSGLFVPRKLTWDVSEDRPRRGGPFFLLGRPGMVTTGHCAFALGVGRLALDAVTELAQEKERGYAGSMDHGSQPGLLPAHAWGSATCGCGRPGPWWWRRWKKPGTAYAPGKSPRSLRSRPGCALLHLSAPRVAADAALQAFSLRRRDGLIPVPRAAKMPARPLTPRRNTRWSAMPRTRTTVNS